MNRREMPRQDAATHRLSAFRLFAYVLPGLPLAALGLPIVVHLPQFYASSEVGLSLAVTGLVFFIMRVFDVAIDPFMGYWSDRYFGSLKQALAYGRSKGFEFSVHDADGIIAAWGPIGGLRYFD